MCSVKNNGNAGGKMEKKTILLREVKGGSSCFEPLMFSNETADLIQFDITSEQKNLLQSSDKTCLCSEFPEAFLRLFEEADRVWYAYEQEPSFKEKEKEGGDVFLLEEKKAYCPCEDEMTEDFYEEICNSMGQKIRYDLTGFLLAFLPWILLWGDLFSSLRSSILYSLTLSTLILGARLLRGKATWLDLCSPIFFVGLYGAYSLQPMWVAHLYGVLGSLYLALVWSVSILFGKPVTSEYTRVKSRDTAHFIKSNENLTLLWIVNFIVQGALFFLNVSPAAHILILLPSITVTSLYYQKHREKKKERKIHPLAR